MTDSRIVILAIAVTMFGIAAIRYWVLFYKWKWYPFRNDTVDNVLVAVPWYTLIFDMYLYFAKDDEEDNHRRAMFGKLAFVLTLCFFVFLAILLMVAIT